MFKSYSIRIKEGRKNGRKAIDPSTLVARAHKNLLPHSRTCVHVCMFSTALIHRVTGCVSASKVLNSLNGSVIFWASGPLFKS